MPKIKTLKIRIKENEELISINCNKQGRFYVNFSEAVETAFGVAQITGDTLDKVEKEVRDLYKEYTSAVTSHVLKIKLTFSVSGSFALTEEGLYDWSLEPRLSGNSFIKKGSYSDGIEFDYNILLEENVGGKVSYYETYEYDSKNLSHCASKLVHGRVIGAQDRLYGSNHLLLDYSESTLKNLASIHDQLYKAARFLSKLVTHPDAPAILESEQLKMLPE